MALKKEITNNKGVATNYHKLGNFSIRKTNDGNYMICAQTLSYVSEKYRRMSENNIIINIDHAIRVSDTEMCETPIYALIYKKLKIIPFFDGAEDC